jgi:hypothetical protein
MEHITRLILARRIDVHEQCGGLPPGITPPHREGGREGSPDSDSDRGEKGSITMHDTRREPPAARNAHALLRALGVAILLAAPRPLVRFGGGG